MRCNSQEIRKIPIPFGHEIWADKSNYYGVFLDGLLLGETPVLSQENYTKKMCLLKGSGVIKAKYIITSRCNQKCYYCYNSGKNSQELVTKDSLKCIDRLKKNGISLIQFHGGEPTVRDDFPDIIQHTDENDMLIWFFTNGSSKLWGEDRIYRRISDLKTKPFITVSILSGDREEHDQLSGSVGSFERLKRTISSLKGIGCDPTISISLNKKTYKQLKPAGRLAQTSGCKIQVITEVFSCLADSSRNQDLHLTDAEIIEARESVIKNKRIELKEDCCMTGRGTLTIDEQGNLIGCERKRTPIYGNILEKDLEELINQQEYHKDVHDFFEKPKSCNNCKADKRNYCKWCSVIPYNFGINKQNWSDYHCNMAEKRRLFWTGE